MFFVGVHRCIQIDVSACPQLLDSRWMWRLVLAALQVHTWVILLALNFQGVFCNTGECVSARPKVPPKGILHVNSTFHPSRL